jgi:hypothetical protein
VLGWEIFVTRQGSDALVATWRTGTGGLEWLNNLVKAHRAVDLGGNGYPMRYSVAAGVILPILTKTLPPNNSPMVIGEDYVLPPGWSEEVQLNAENAAACRADEQLMVEAWDQS